MHFLFSGGFSEPIGFTPKIWYKANAETAYTDGAAVTQVTDWSGNAMHLTTVGGAGITYQTNEFASYPAFYGAGTGDIRKDNVGSGALIAASNGTCFCVARPAVNNNGFPWLLSETGVTSKAAHQANAGATLTAFTNDGGVDVTASKAHVVGTIYILTLLHTGGNTYLGSNDTRTASMASVASGNTIIAAGDDMFMFGSGGANYYNGYVAEFIGFNTALTEAERQTWERWFGAKYAVSLPY